jgi:phenylalanyl-tRNA synthetase beta chain
MIITKSWLNEWIELDNISSDELAKTLNRIGLEVDRVLEFSAPEGVVVGKILETEQHPDADRLQVCRVDIGSETVQIVTNDKKVGEGDFVPVATVGTQLPKVKIKKGKLRGIESLGMFCSTEEFGIPRVGEGVVILDDSIGELEEGKALSEFPIFNDTLIEIELTANRGDCLSLYGVGRDVASALDLNFQKEFSPLREEKGDFEIDYNLESYKISLESELPLYIRTRLAIAEKLSEKREENLTSYITHSTGVVANFVESSEKLEVRDEVLHFGDSKVGIANEKGDVLQFSYIDPEKISRDVYEKKLKTDSFYYNSSRGSEPNISIGVDFLKSLEVSEIYQVSRFSNISPKREVSITFHQISTLIGYPVEAKRVENILEKLGFDFEKRAESLLISVPKFRTDINNRADVVEEILRMVGIDEIPVEGMAFSELRRDNETSNKIEIRNRIRKSAVANGFYETLLYLFGEEKIFQKYGFETISEDRKLLNPIVDFMDTMRPTLTVGLLQALQRNISFGKRRVPLFEIGRVVEPDREEREMLAFAFAGEVKSDSIANGGKPKEIDFQTFTEKVLLSIGGGEVVQSEAESPLEHPYQVASILQNGEKIGKIYKLHLKVQNDFDLPVTYLAEIEFEKLTYPLQLANPISKFQGSSRDLSVVIDSDQEFAPIKKAITDLENPLLVEFYPIDIFQLEDGKSSLTIRFQLQSSEKTLEESEITSFTDGVLETLQREFGVTLR